MALVAVSFTYGGYQQTINFGDEVKNPQKNLPRGIFIGIIVIILLYLSVSYAYYKVIGFEELKNAKGIAAIVAERMFGPTGKFAFSILLFIAVLAYVNVLLLSNPRVMFAMSEDGILPKAFSKKDEKRDVLTVSLTVYAMLSVVVLFFADTFDKILSFTIFWKSNNFANSRFVFKNHNNPVYSWSHPTMWWCAKFKCINHVTKFTLLLFFRNF